MASSIQPLPLRLHTSVLSLYSSPLHSLAPASLLTPRRIQEGRDVSQGTELGEIGHGAAQFAEVARGVALVSESDRSSVTRRHAKDELQAKSHSLLHKQNLAARGY